MNRRLMACVAVAIAAVVVGCAPPFDPGTANALEESPLITPDYRGTTIPPNGAPLNFMVIASGSRYVVTVQGTQGPPLRVSSADTRVVFPRRAWRTLLSGNVGTDLRFAVSVHDRANGWRTYRTFTVAVAKEPIDPYLACRIIKPIYSRWRDVGIYQRNIETSETSEIAHGRSFGDGCVNCHSFLNNNPNRMFLGTRSATYGSAAILVEDKRAIKLGTKFGYTSWHPSGRLVAYPTMDVNQFFHTTRAEVRDVIDMSSSILYYSLDTRSVRPLPRDGEGATLETYPAWAPDGKTLYFCRASALWDSTERVPPRRYSEVKYSLWKISYDMATDTWGKADTVLSSASTGKSILLPRVSPDARFLVFCMCDYGVFPAFQKSSDLYAMDLRTGTYRSLDVNSPESESWHSWSSNSRWLAFSSKREDGVFTRTYVSYIDVNGEARKPFLIPHTDPSIDASLLKTYSVPEFITGPVRVSGRAIGAAARSGNPQPVTLHSSAGSYRATPSSSAAPEQ